MPSPKLKDLTGRKFNNFTVLKLSTNQPCKTHRYWDCVCICGNHRSVSSSNLGKIKGCGCVRKEYERTGKYAGKKVKQSPKQQYNFVITSPFARTTKKEKSDEMKKQNIVRRKVEDIQEQLRLAKELAL